MCKVIMILVMLLMISVSVEAADVTAWTKTDVGLEVVTEGLLLADWGQTLWIREGHVKMTTSQNGLALKSTYCETNTVLGKFPSRSSVNGYFAGWMVGHAVVAHYLPTVVKALGGSDWTAKYSRTIWQALVIGVETCCVGTNITAGVHMSF